MTNFENIPIRDADAIVRKVAGDMVVQGPDTLFHQTARNLNTIIQEVTGVTLASATPTDIALNGMESHVIVDIRSVMDNPLVMQLQYTSGGPFYAANWERMQPIRATPGIRDWGADWNVEGGDQSTGTEPFNNDSGSHVFMIPTNGAVTCRLQLYGSSVTKTGTAWKRVVLASAPYQHVISKAVTKRKWQSYWYQTAAQPYVSGDVMGINMAINSLGDTGGEAYNLYKLRSLMIHGDADALPDFDFVIGTTSFTPTDGAAGVGTDISDVRYVIEFRAAPTGKQFPIFTLGAARTAAIADELDFTFPDDWNAGGSVGRFALIAREAFAVNTYLPVNMLIDAG